MLNPFMTDKLTTVKLGEGTVYAITVDADTGNIIGVDAAPLPRSTKEPVMVRDDKAGYVFDND